MKCQTKHHKSCRPTYDLWDRCGFWKQTKIMARTVLLVLCTLVMLHVATSYIPDFEPQIHQKRVSSFRNSWLTQNARPQKSVSSFRNSWLTQNSRPQKSVSSFRNSWLTQNSRPQKSLLRSLSRSCKYIAVCCCYNFKFFTFGEEVNTKIPISTVVYKLCPKSQPCDTGSNHVTQDFNHETQKSQSQSQHSLQMQCICVCKSVKAAQMLSNAAFMGHSVLWDTGFWVQDTLRLGHSVLSSGHTSCPIQASLDNKKCSTRVFLLCNSFCKGPVVFAWI